MSLIGPRASLHTPAGAAKRLAAPSAAARCHRRGSLDDNRLDSQVIHGKLRLMLQRFSIWIDKKTLASLKVIGKQKERPVGWIMRKAIEEYVDNEKKTGQ